MNKNNEVYYIEDIHPVDGFYDDRHFLIGKQIINIGIDEEEWIEGWKGTYSGDVVCNDADWNGMVFYAVRLTSIPPKKSFLQKLFTWSW